MSDGNLGDNFKEVQCKEYILKEQSEESLEELLTNLLKKFLQEKAFIRDSYREISWKNNCGSSFPGLILDKVQCSSLLHEGKPV